MFSWLRAPRLSGSRAILSFHQALALGRFRFALRAALRFNRGIVHEKAEGRRAVRKRNRSRVVRIRGKRARRRTMVRGTASSTNAEPNRGRSLPV